MTRSTRSGLVLMGTLVSIFAGMTPGSAQTAEELIQSKHVMIRHRLEPPEPVFVGQPVRVWVEVMTQTWFLEAPQIPTAVEVRNAIVIPPDAFGVNSSERVGGDTYAVQGRSYTVFPQTAGSFEVPPIPVRLVVARDDASRSPEINLQTDPVVIEARLPAGAEGHGRVLATRGLTVQETYDRAMDGLKVGDSFKRQVTMTIQDSVAMLLPPIPFQVDEGVSVYPGRPDVADQRNRGTLTGTRIDEATYVMEAEGTYRLQKTSIWWWNLRTSSLEQEVLPAVEFTVEANPDLATEHLGQQEEEEVLPEASEVIEAPSWGVKEWALALGALVLGVLVLRKIRQEIDRNRSVGRREEESEETFFHHFESAARSNDPWGTYAALLQWLDRFEPVASPASVRSLVCLVDDEDLATECEALEGLLYDSPGPGEGEAWSGLPLATAVGRTRNRLRAPKRAMHGSLEPLPPLNP